MASTAGSTTRSRALLALLIGYFAVFVYATITNDPLAATVAALGFGAITIAVGAMLYDRTVDPGPVVWTAVGCLVAGGLLQFVVVLTGLPAVDSLSSLLVLVGLGCYVYVVWRER